MDGVVPGGGCGAGKTVRASVAAALFLALWVLPLGQAKSEGAVKDKHGNWETRCETPPGAASEQCAIVQSVADEERPNITLVVIALKTADRIQCCTNFGECQFTALRIVLHVNSGGS